MAILALDADDHVLMVRQFRLAAGQTLLEVPAGTLDVAEDGTIEDPDLAAPRELEEETGMRAATWRPLGHFYTAPGFTSELMTCTSPRTCAPADDDRLGPDEDERLLAERIPAPTPWPRPNGARSTTRSRSWRCSGWPACGTAARPD